MKTETVVFGTDAEEAEMPGKAVHVGELGTHGPCVCQSSHANRRLQQSKQVGWAGGLRKHSGSITVTQVMGWGTKGGVGVIGAWKLLGHTLQGRGSALWGGGTTSLLLLEDVGSSEEVPRAGLRSLLERAHQLEMAPF